ncbi:hypothetical protein QJS10_CPA05g01288 [Acorus calamus]|uniref:Uncharacterized protein n=1 Tax=Acorus calamus TaxID=4465 RepID=A0AAV9EWJ0_ACOCL|nr:hypothetical protein QJS10_CPA05g01288 [Acorus calamus]
MERILKKYDKEFLKMIMLRQEQTLKEQVYELHRLYRIQKVLMNDMKNNVLKGQRIPAYIEADLNHSDNNCNNRQMTCQLLNLELPPEEADEAETRDVMVAIEESEIELTLGRGGSTYRKRQETSAGTDSSASISSSSSECVNHQRTNATEFMNCDWGLQQYANMSMGYQSELLRQDTVKQPPWLFHGLSLSTT